MTTAHRPTFHAAIAGKQQGGGRYVSGVSRQHVHDLPSEMSIKSRSTGQGTQAEVGGRDLRALLEAKEAEHLQAIGKTATHAKASTRTQPPPLPPPDDDDDDDEGDGVLIDPEDADDQLGGRANGASDAKFGGPGVAGAADDSDDSDDDDDDDDDEEELMRELERIKKERAQEALRREREESETVAAERDSSSLQGNPLLDPTRAGSGSKSTFAVKRRWDDDVVFKNQSREPKKEARRFINDTVRNDFHRRFLNKYVK